MSASKHWERRIPIYLIGMFLMTIGVNLSVLSGIGVSPIDTLPYIVSLIAQKSLGLCTTLVFSVYILLQIVILRRRFQWKNLLQIVLSIIFGWFVSLSGALTALLPQHPSSCLLPVKATEKARKQRIPLSVTSSSSGAKSGKSSLSYILRKKMKDSQSSIFHLLRDLMMRRVWFFMTMRLS